MGNTNNQKQSNDYGRVVEISSKQEQVNTKDVVPPVIKKENKKE